LDRVRASHRAETESKTTILKFKWKVFGWQVIACASSSLGPFASHGIESKIFSMFVWVINNQLAVLKGSWCRLEGGWIGESWKSPLKTNLSVKPGYSGIFSGVSRKSGISGKISGVSGLMPSQRNEHTAQNRCHRFCKSGATGFSWQWLPSSSPSCLLVWLELKLDE
jgi:hypothetical protein